MSKINIAIDGFSSCGKSTIAKGLASKLNYVYIDTGAMYRAITLAFLRNDRISDDGEVNQENLGAFLDDINISFEYNDETGQSETILNGENVEQEIRQMEVSQWVSVVSAIPDVRKKLVAIQQEIGKRKGVVMDGRDIGTVVFPDAELKVFVTADPEVRAQRRYDELIRKGQDVSFDEVLENLAKRDELDQSREVSPLKQADDARILDNTELSIEEQLDLVYSWAMDCIKS